MYKIKRVKMLSLHITKSIDPSVRKKKKLSTGIYFLTQQNDTHESVCLAGVFFLPFTLPLTKTFTHTSVRHFPLITRSLFSIDSTSALPKPWACKGISNYSDSRFSCWIKALVVFLSIDYGNIYYSCLLEK